MIRFCDQFAVIDGSTNQNDRQELAKVTREGFITCYRPQT